MIGSNSSARLSCTGTVKLGVWVFACLLWIAGPQVKAQDGQHQVPNAPGTNTADASQNGTSAPTPQQPDQGNPPPSSLKLPNLLQNVTPGEGRRRPRTPAVPVLLRLPGSRPPRLRSSSLLRRRMVRLR